MPEVGGGILTLVDNTCPIIFGAVSLAIRAAGGVCPSEAGNCSKVTCLT